MSFSSVPAFPIDKDAFSGRDNGIIYFEKVSEKSEDEIEEENQKAQVEILRTKYVYDVLEPLGYLDKILDVGLAYNTEMLLATYPINNGEITVSAEVSAEQRNISETEYNIAITLDNTGNLSIGCQEQIAAVTTEIDLGEIGNGEEFEKILSNIALSVKEGNITLSAPLVSAKQAEFSICVSSNDLMPEDPDIEAAIAVEVKYKIEINDDNNDQFNVEEFALATGQALAKVVVVATICLVAAIGIPILLNYLGTIGFLVLVPVL